MKALVLATNYPSKEASIGLMYIHTRNVYYKDSGIDVTVLNFSAKENYSWDGISVITLKEYVNNPQEYDVLISHAPNIRNHFRFIVKNQKKYDNIIFFFHGHEVLYRSRVYSKPYSYVKVDFLKKFFNDMYDTIKLVIWRTYLPRLLNKSHLVFVSNWMYDEFKKWVKIKDASLKDRKLITYNSISKEFENSKYDTLCEKVYDCITIRGNLDGSKYAVDVVCDIAKNNPDKKFLVIGKGEYFKYNNKPQNVEVRYEYLNHMQICEYLNKSKCALMPTRTDAQGLMACEMASFGIPLITSDIEVCHEVFEGFNNVGLINNDNPNIKFKDVYNKLICEKVVVYDKYYAKTTVKNEIKLIKSLESTDCSE